MLGDQIHATGESMFWKWRAEGRSNAELAQGAHAIAQRLQAAGDLRAQQWLDLAHRLNGAPITQPPGFVVESWEDNLMFEPGFVLWGSVFLAVCIFAIGWVMPAAHVFGPVNAETREYWHEFYANKEALTGLRIMFGVLASFVLAFGILASRALRK